MKTVLALALTAVAIVAFTLGRAELERRDRKFLELQGRVDSLAIASDIRHAEPPRVVSVTPELRGPAPSPAATLDPPNEGGGGQRAPSEKPVLGLPEIHERYEEAFIVDRADAEWAARARRIADEKLPSLLPEGSAIRSFECRASLCRLETVHRDRDSYWVFMKNAFMTPSGRLWNGPVYSAPLNDDPDDRFMVSYIAREGRTLPAIAE